jgi:hypothetical protein
LAGCDGIGTTWSALLPDDYPGAIYDPVLTRQTHILKTIPFGMKFEVDKGFLCENDAILHGVFIERPQKMPQGQTQQAAEDTAQTQKVGNTRIPIEQLNGATKAAARWLNGEVPISQLSLLSLVIRTTFLMQNFRPGFVQGREVTPEEGRPSRAEVRYYGATEDGLFDARENPELWATVSEMKRWGELRVQHPGKTPVEISELVLKEDIPERLRHELLEGLQG